MIQACFNHRSDKVGSGSDRVGSDSVAENLITCNYQTRIFNSLTYLTLTWSKSLLSHSLTIHTPDCISFTISLYPNPSPLSFIRNRPGSKCISQSRQTHHNHLKIKLYWDFTRAEFTHNSAEPEYSSFYIAITCNERLEFFLGDLISELTRRRPKLVVAILIAESTQLSRREHVFGRNRSYVTRSHFMGCKREIGIECGSGGVLKVKFDGLTCLVVKRLAWKFRGNEKIRVDGIGMEIEFFWDVFNWVVVDHDDGNGRRNDGYGLFLFQVGTDIGNGVWPEIMDPEKGWLTRNSLSMLPAASLSPATSSSSVLQWAEESSSESCGRSSCSSSTLTRSSCNGFSLSIYAWRKRCN